MAYDNNINPGNAPLVWSRIKNAFDRINENFTIIGSTLARNAPYNIANIDQSNPVKVTTTDSHSFISGQQATISDTGVTELDNNTYYVKVISTDELELYNDETLVSPVNGVAYTAYSSGGGEIQGLSEYSSLDFNDLASNVSPNETDTYNLGSSTKAWQKLYLSEYGSGPTNYENGLWIGSAQVKGITGTIDLPANSTVDGSLIIDPDKEFYKFIEVDDGDRIQANQFNDTLPLYSGTGMQITVSSAADSLTFINTGVTQLTAGSGINLSAATGNITVTNTGVLSVTNTTSLPAAATGRAAGTGVTVSASTGNLIFTNTGVISVTQGSGIIVSSDPATGDVTISNGSPANNTFAKVYVTGTDPISDVIEADILTDTLNVTGGYGIDLTPTPASDTLTIDFNNNVDIVGSVFADDSTLMVDAVDNKIYASGGFFGNLTGNVTGNVAGNVTGNVAGNLTGDSTGYHTGDVKGSVFADDSSTMVNAVDNSLSSDTLTVTTGIITDLTSPILRAKDIYAIDAAGVNISANGSNNLVVLETSVELQNVPVNVANNLNVSGTITGYHVGDMTGSVFADNSSLLVDGVSGKIVGPVESDNIRGTFIGTVYADDSTQIIDPEGTVTGIHVPGSTTPASEFADGKTYEIRVDDDYIWVKTSTGAWKKAALGGFV